MDAGREEREEIARPIEEQPPPVHRSGPVRIVGAQPARWSGAGPGAERSGDDTPGEPGIGEAEARTESWLFPGDSSSDTTWSEAELGREEIALPHWTEAPTGEVPAVFARDTSADDSGPDPWETLPPPTWREHDTDWSRGEAARFEPSMLDSGESRLGSLAGSEETDPERQPWSFDLPPSGETAAVGREPVGGELGEEAPPTFAAGGPPHDAGPPPPPRGNDDTSVMPAVRLLDDGGSASAGSALGHPETIAPPPARGAEPEWTRPSGRQRAVGSRPDRGDLGPPTGDVPAASMTGAGGPSPDAPYEDLAAVGASVAPGDLPARGESPVASAGPGTASEGRVAVAERVEDEPSSAARVRPAPPRDRRRRRGGGRGRPPTRRLPERPAEEPPALRARPREPQPGRRNLPVAIGTGVLLGGIALVFFDLGTVTAMIVATAVITLCAVEAYAAFRRAAWHPVTILGILSTVSVMIATYNKGQAALPLVAVLLLAFAFLWHLAGVERVEDPLRSVASTVFVFLWIGAFGSFAALLLDPSLFPNKHGLAFLGGAIIVAVAYDVAALAVGAWIGRHPIAPSISPNKTWEGLIGGAVAAILAGVIIVHLIHPWTVGKAAVLGIVVAIVSPIGDFTESFVKRHLGLKDMGRILPGHGGFLDRMDGLLFVLPATYYLVKAFHLG